jgi:hypothetical protein
LDPFSLQAATNFLFFTLYLFAIRRCTMVSHMRAAPNSAISRSSHTAVVAEIFIGRMLTILASRFLTLEAASLLSVSLGYFAKHSPDDFFTMSRWR